MKTMLFIALFFLGFIPASIGQKQITDLLTKKVIAFLHANPEDSVLYQNGLTVNIYPRKQLNDLLNKTEGVILIDYTFLYQDAHTSRTKEWKSMNIAGNPFNKDKSILDSQLKSTPRKFFRENEFQTFLANNKKNMPTRIQYAEFMQIYWDLHKSRLAFYSEKPYHPGVYKFREGNYYGLMDHLGCLLLPAQYEESKLNAAFHEQVVPFGKSLNEFVVRYIELNMENWNQKDEFETPEEYNHRIHDFSSNAIHQFASNACRSYQEVFNLNILSQCSLESYDAIHHTFLLKTPLGDIPISVAPEASRAFKIAWENKKIEWSKIYFNYLQSELTLAFLEFYDTDSRAIFWGISDLVYQNDQITQNNSNIRIKIHKNDYIVHQENDIPITPADVDTNIPTTNTVADKTFAVIIANEAYSHEVKVPFALNDGEVFARYCQKTLGIPEKNIRVVKNATLNDMKFHLNWLAQVLAAYNGTAKAIVYYAGHGIPDEKQQSAYLLPADGYGSDPSTAYALQDFYAMLNNAQARNITVFLDACFSGAKRENGMLASARGVAIKVRQEIPRGKMVIFTAAQGDETAYQYAEKGHGMFTYFLLKKLQESQGNTTLGELSDYVTDEVKKNSIVNNNKSQTPTVIPAEGMAQGWKEMTLK